MASWVIQEELSNNLELTFLPLPPSKKKHAFFLWHLKSVFLYSKTPFHGTSTSLFPSGQFILDPA